MKEVGLVTTVLALCSTHYQHYNSLFAFSLVWVKSIYFRNPRSTLLGREEQPPQEFPVSHNILLLSSYTRYQRTCAGEKHYKCFNKKKKNNFGVQAPLDVRNDLSQASKPRKFPEEVHNSFNISFSLTSHWSLSKSKSLFQRKPPPSPIGSSHFFLLQNTIFLCLLLHQLCCISLKASINLSWFEFYKLEGGTLNRENLRKMKCFQIAGRLFFTSYCKS